MYLSLTRKVNNFLDNEFIKELYVILMALVTMIGWRFNTIIGISILLGVSIVMILLSGSLNYIIPNLIYFIFNINKGFTTTEFPLYLIILLVVLVVVLIGFTIINGFKLKKLKSIIGLFGMGIFMLIPMIWFKVYKPEHEIFRFIYLAGLAYALLYVLVVNGFKGDTISILVRTMSFLPIILCYENAYTAYSLKDTTDNVLKLWYYLGWGLCNESGIMICMSLPFIFYLIGNNEKTYCNIYNNLKVIVAIIGIVLTTSRASYLFGGLIILASYFGLLFVAKDKSKYFISFMVGLAVILVLAIIFRENVFEFCKKIKNLVFDHGFDGNGREGLWKEAFNIFKSNPRNIILGQGFSSVIRGTETAAGIQDGIIVFHSTLLESLVIGGICGTIFLIIHFIEKYKAIFKINKLFAVTMLIGYVAIDIYGMIDNTYFMYYYMVTLMVIMASIDSTIYYKNMN